MVTFTSPKTKPFDVPDTIPKARAWVNNLPLNNFTQATRLIYQCMFTLNKHPLNPIQRIEITEVIRPYVELILDHLAKYLVDRSFPLPEKSQKIFDLHQALLLEVAGAYQLSALEILTKEVVNKKLLSIATGRSLGYMGQILSMAYSVYIQISDSIWRDIHHLYLIAVEQKIATIHIPSKSSITPHCHTIEDIYKLITLTSLSNPYSLRIGEIGRVVKFYSLLLKKVNIHQDPEKLTKKYAHIVFLNSDEHAALMPTAELFVSPTIRIIDIDKINDELDVYINSSGNPSAIRLNNDYPMMTTSLAKRLKVLLAVVRNRQYKRFKRTGKVTIVHQILPIAKIIEQSQQSSKKDLSDAEAADEMYDDLIYGSGLSSVNAIFPEEKNTALDDDMEVSLRLWKILNSSYKGYGLTWTNTSSVEAKVGELVAIHDAKDQDNEWQIGNIRWMQYFVGKGLCIGIEVLAPSVSVFTVTSIENRSLIPKLPITGLYIPIVEGIQSEAKLILPDYIFKSGDRLSINMNNEVMNIEISYIDEQVGTFSFCSFVSEGDSHFSNTSTKLESSTFDQLWDDL